MAMHCRKELPKRSWKIVLEVYLGSFKNSISVLTNEAKVYLLQDSHPSSMLSISLVLPIVTAKEARAGRSIASSSSNVLASAMLI